ncbi:MAG: 5'/3'-nucleotidase SurE, partial [Anaerolineaceae bacterium]
SLDAPEHFSGILDYETAAVSARKVVEILIKHPFGTDILLNVNVPYLSGNDLKGFRPTRQGMRIYRDELIRREDPRGKPYFWIGGDAPTGVDEIGTDFGDLKAGYVSISPIQLDMTAYKVLENIKGWEWPLK